MKLSEEQKTEYWDLYRADGKLEKIIPSRGYDIPANMYHMTVEVIPTDRAGHVLVTQRAFNKRLGPGKLEFPAGSVLSGEQPYVAARRELLEETGLKAASLEKIGTYIEPRIQRTVYLAHIPDLCNAHISLQETETIGYQILTFRQWMDSISQERFETSKFRNYTPQMLKKLEKEIGAAEEPEPISVPDKLRKVEENLFAKYQKKRNGPPQEIVPEGISFEELFQDEEMISDAKS